MANHPFSELEELLQEFPFFTAGHLLLLKQYRLQNSSRYKKQHRKVLTLVPDPVQAFLFTEGDAWMPSGAESVPPDLLPQVDSGVLHTSSDPGECPSANPAAVPPVDGLQTDDIVECIITNNTENELLAEIGAIDTDGSDMERSVDGGLHSPLAREEGNGTNKEGVAEVEEMAVTAEKPKSIFTAHLSRSGFISPPSSPTRRSLWRTPAIGTLSRLRRDCKPSRIG